MPLVVLAAKMELLRLMAADEEPSVRLLRLLASESGSW
jgi:hypothetical protein